MASFQFSSQALTWLDTPKHFQEGAELALRQCWLLLCPTGSPCGSLPIQTVLGFLTCEMKRIMSLREACKDILSNTCGSTVPRAKAQSLYIPRAGPWNPLQGVTILQSGASWTVKVEKVCVVPMPLAVSCQEYGEVDGDSVWFI